MFRIRPETCGGLERWAEGLGVGALEGVGDAEEEMFVGDGADELEADGEARGSEAAGDG